MTVNPLHIFAEDPYLEIDKTCFFFKLFVSRLKNYFLASFNDFVNLYFITHQAMPATCRKQNFGIQKPLVEQLMV